jgi:hypothetical protein
LNGTWLEYRCVDWYFYLYRHTSVPASSRKSTNGLLEYSFKSELTPQTPDQSAVGKSTVAPAPVRTVRNGKKRTTETDVSVVKRIGRDGKSRKPPNCPQGNSHRRSATTGDLHRM